MCLHFWIERIDTFTQIDLHIYSIQKWYTFIQFCTSKLNIAWNTQIEYCLNIIWILYTFIQFYARKLNIVWIYKLKSFEICKLNFVWISFEYVNWKSFEMRKLNIVWILYTFIQSNVRTQTLQLFALHTPICTDWEIQYNNGLDIQMQSLTKKFITNKPTGSKSKNKLQRNWFFHTSMEDKQACWIKIE